MTNDTFTFIAAVPAGILQDLVFNENVPAAVNYGAAGFIGGHEMSHAVRYYLKDSLNILGPLECISEQSGLTLGFYN